MKNLKKMTAFFLTAIMLFTAVSPVMAAAALNADEPLQTLSAHEMTEVQPLPFTIDDFFNQPSEKWENLVSGVAPATLPYSYTLADDVIEIDSNTNVARNVISNIATAGMRFADQTNTELTTDPNKLIGQGGYIDTNVLRTVTGENTENGQVIFDKASGTAFKLAAPFSNSPATEVGGALSGTYKLEAPRLNEIFKTFSMGTPGQAVDLTYANMVVPDEIYDCVEDKSILQQLAAGKTGFEHVQKHQWPFPLQFDSKNLTAYTSSGGKIQVRLQEVFLLEISNWSGTILCLSALMKPRLPLRKNSISQRRLPPA